MKRNYFTLIVLCCFILVLKSQTPQGFFLDDWTPKLINIPAYTVAVATSSSPTITVTVDVNNVLNKVTKSMYGHNAHTWAGQYNLNTTFTNHVKNLVAGVIRYPGGSLSDNYYWNASNNATMPSDLPSDFNYNDLHWGATKAGWSLSLNNYYDLLAKTNTTGIITVNYAYARVGTSATPVANAAHLAADWVRYDNGRTRYWEIGNEEYGKWEYGFTIDPTLNKDNQPTSNTGLNYGKHCSIFIDSMRVAAKQVGNDIKIGVVCSADNPDSQWNMGLLPQVATKTDYLIAHNYYTPKGTWPVATFLDATDNTKNPKDYLIADLLKYGKVSSLPVALTEWNARDTTSDNRNCSVINGVFATIVLGEAMKNGYALSTRWAFMNSIHSLIGNTSSGIYAPYPTFFYMYYFQKMFGDKVVNTTIAGISGAKTDSLRAWSSTFSSSQAGIVLVNKGVNQRTISVKILNYLKGKKYYYYVLSGENGSTYSQRVVINGQTTTDTFGGPANYATLQPYGTDIVNGVINVTLPKYGVIFLIVENGNGNTATENVYINNGLKFDFSPNPSLDNIKINIAGFESPKITISDMLGKTYYQSEILSSNQVSLNPRTLTKCKGLFFLTITGKNGTLTKKIILE